MTQDEIIALLEKAKLGATGSFGFLVFKTVGLKELTDFANLVSAKATEEANAKANASWELMCKKMVSFEREAYEHDIEVLMNALWKACGDDAEVVNATIESQGELTRVRGEQA
jgi:hypothetical protein